ncbi:MAG: hypothetical protein QOG26_63 [Solirubrobacterales bacterium]|nr:hypothetical protein [Solirubrobacterales bacterium]
MRRPLIATATATATALGAAWAAPALAPIAAPIARALGVPRRLDSLDTVAVTFDDGPHPEGTPAALEALRDAGASATFFLVGEQVERYLALTAEIAAAGHAVAVHGYRHRNPLRLTPRAFSEDLERAIETIGAAAGQLRHTYRPPYGIFSPAGLRIVRARGLAPLLWSRWGHDWRRRATADSIATELTRDLGAGDVLLLHDADHYSSAGSWIDTAAALPRVLGAIEAAGLVTQTV